MMGATAFPLLMLQKSVNSKQKILKLKISFMSRKYFRRFFSLWHKKAGLNGCVYNFSVDYRAFDTSNIIDIHKYLIKKHDIK